MVRRSSSRLDRALAAWFAPDSSTIEEAAGKRAIRAFLQTVWLYSLALWAYAATVAVISAKRIGESLFLVQSLPRTDTSGIVAFGTSALCYVLLGILSRAGAVGSVLRAMALYGFLGWLYIAGNAVAHPYTLAMPLMHLSTRPTESQFGVTCFILSALGSGALWARPQPGP
jgi:hypothetical protein